LSVKIRTITIIIFITAFITMFIIAILKTIRGWVATYPLERNKVFDGHDLMIDKGAVPTLGHGLVALGSELLLCDANLLEERLEKPGNPDSQLSPGMPARGGTGRELTQTRRR
jgi:hypothetical protein